MMRLINEKELLNVRHVIKKHYLVHKILEGEL